MTPENLLDGLDAQQRVAAEALLGPVCILAGAGTGKTRAITHRIAYGVASGAYAPNRVMALTFTNRAAAELRGRLRQLGAGGVAARTFHAAALSQLNFFWPQVVGGQLPSVLDAKGRILGHAAERLGFKVDTATLRDVAAEIEWRKVSGLSIEQYGGALASRTLPGNLSAEQIVLMQQTYEDLKDERKQFDFEDVLLACAGMIEIEPAVAMQVREQYRFFVVDEYQDVSPLQQQLLDLWLGGRRDVCVVGDASQTIYSFAGASSSYLLEFGRHYAGATVVRLEQNYRSTPEVVDAANRLMRGRTGALTLRSSTERDQPDAAAEADVPPPTGFADDRAEARAVAQRIAAEIADGAKPEDIAVLYRVNVQAAVLEQALGDLGISYHIRGAKRFFDLPEVRQAIMSLRAASVSIGDEPLFKSVSDVLRSLGWSQDPPEARGAVRDRWESLNAIMGLVDQVPTGTTFRRFTDELLARQAGQHEPTRSAVTLATLHSAKGLEWESVHLVGLSEGLVPISYAKTFEQIDEERRLLYVGITRARRRLKLTWSATGNPGGRATARQPSRFLAELGTRSPRAVSAPAPS
ncbi:ATP-dependent helicase [Leifsonia poae]|uniref:DNA 3'-5' helicase n=1 Tax=Leifsonia poae TaxID=110933 RepID=A0A9W6M188_9MICO|nr:ATP-dependent helicase [Leifsonia poae]GLJ77552.1 hypothetical protein GCM10017584_31260 [Leifsonia poae]